MKLNRIVEIVGVSGIGKSHLIELAESRLNGRIEIVSFGDLLRLNAQNILEGRDLSSNKIEIFKFSIWSFKKKITRFKLTKV